MTHDSDQFARLARRNEEISDADLVGRARADDRGAFEMLVRRHYRAAFAVALAHVRTRADAEDVCHDAFIRAAERLASCRNPDRFLQWLCAIVRNHARNVSARGFFHRAVELVHATALSRDDPVRALEVKELGERLESALRRLSSIQRETILLHDLHGCTHEDIAGIIGTSPGMSRQHLFKARRRLREVLGEHATSEYLND
jgi:RNA polymerase sigma-70 factor (ECF subfamily)